MALGRKTGGRVRGSLNKATAEVRHLASEYGQAAIKQLAILAEQAKSERAQIAACTALLDRGYGKSTSNRHIEIDLPDTSGAEGVVEALALVVTAASKGEITTAEASDLCSILEAQRRAIETSDLEARFTRLEAMIEGRR